MSEQIVVPEDAPLSVSVNVHGNQVLLQISEPREYLAFSAQEPVFVGAQMLCKAVVADREQAQAVLDMCMTIMDFVYEECPTIKPIGGGVKQQLIDRHRKTLTQRLSLVLNGTREKKKTSNQELARQLVEICISEIFS